MIQFLPKAIISINIGLDFNHIDHFAVVSDRFDPKELPSIPETKIAKSEYSLIFKTRNMPKLLQSVFNIFEILFFSNRFIDLQTFFLQ